MDGPLVVVMVAYLVFPIIWVYQRFFESVGPESKELAARCRMRPLLAALSVEASQADDIAQRLERALGRKHELALSLGGWPWTHHVLRVEVTSASGEVRIHAVDCRVRRARDTRVVALTELLLATLREFSLSADDNWLLPEAYRRVTGPEAPNGWRLLPDSTEKFPLEPAHLARKRHGRSLSFSNELYERLERPQRLRGRAMR